MKTLITGAAGFIGLSLVQRLISLGFEIVGVDRIAPDKLDPEAAQLLLQQGPQVQYRQLDLLDAASLQTLSHDFQLIFHFAGILGVQTVLQQPALTLHDNSMLAWHMAEFAKTQAHLSALFFTSTSEVYAGTLQAFGMPIPTPETTPLTLTALDNPRTSYMLSKLWGEAIFQFSGLPCYLLRPHNIYGPRMGMRHVIPQILAKAHTLASGDALEVYSASHTRAFCYIDDAIDFLAELVTQPSPTGAVTLNLGNADEEISMRDLCALILQVVAKDNPVQALPDTPGSPARRAPDLTDIVMRSGHHPKVSIAAGVQQTYAWYKQHVF